MGLLLREARASRYRTSTRRQHTSDLPAVRLSEETGTMKINNVPACGESNHHSLVRKTRRVALLVFAKDTRQARLAVQGWAKYSYI